MLTRPIFHPNYIEKKEFMFMAAARKCDRCGMFHHHYTKVLSTKKKSSTGTPDSGNGIKLMNTDEHDWNKHTHGCPKDLCETCFDELVNWLRGSSFHEQEVVDEV